jgi:Zn-dependent protease with chaperone function
MYNQIIYFIIALLLFTLQQPGSQALRPPTQTLISVFAVFACFMVFCQLAFLPLQRAIERQYPTARLIALYHRIQARLTLSVLAILAVYIYVLDIKFYLQAVPGFAKSLTVSGVFGLGLYLLHLAVIWFSSHPFHDQIHQQRSNRLAFVGGNCKFYLALLIPWLLLSLASDLLQFVQESLNWPLLTSDIGQILLMGFILAVFLAFSPWLVVRLWRCTPIPQSQVREELERFCQEQRFRVGDFMTWPILTGDAYTAGIIGVLPQLRYILVTPALLRLLNIDELKAVAAHEMGHVRRFHIPLYLVFFLCFSILSYALNDILLLFLLKQDRVLSWALSQQSQQQTLFTVAYSIPVVILMVLYFRFIFGFFMRNSERQADVYALELLGHPVTLVSSLHKLAVASGHIHDLPSWHHYSIRERMTFLMECSRDPSIIRNHHRKLYGAATLFLLLVIALTVGGVQFKHTTTARAWQHEVIARMLEHQILARPESMELAGGAELFGFLGSVLLERGRYVEAQDYLQRAVEKEPNDPQLLNNLAWLYATSPEPYRAPEKALELALKAASLKREPYILDTLAEAYYANGRYGEALEAVSEALERQPENSQYYLEQKKKIQSALEPSNSTGKE